LDRRNMGKWLDGALDYIPRWLAHQMRQIEQPGAVLAIAHKGKPVFEKAFGIADVDRGAALTPAHRFRVASHSKTFTAAGIMKLREQGRITLDEPVGRHVKGLHPAVARTTLTQLLSHGSGIIRDGTDSGQWLDRRPFLNEAELRSALAEAPVIDASTRFKYSNHGFGLAGLVIEALTGEPYDVWIGREIVDAAGLAQTEPDMPLAKPAPVASGHSGKLPVGRRLVIPGTNPTRALAAATGFVSTARDLCRFFAHLDSAARGGVLAPSSRREMVRTQWRDAHSSVEQRYGLGTMGGRIGGWDWFGHGGAFQGFISRTVMLPEPGLTLSLVTNAVDGPAGLWVEGIAQILRRFARDGAPARRLHDWTGRWWTLWGAVDLVPVGDKVLVADPSLANPFMDASEITLTGRDRGKVTLASAYASHGEEVRLVRGSNGKISAVWLAGGVGLPEGRLVAEMERRYGRKR
jgi:CubicO group peptidase (beta-lactamase class C family)